MKYHAYNLIIDSPISLKPLHEADSAGVVDVVLHQGVISPRGIPESGSFNIFFQATEDCVWLDIINVARFLIEGGRRVTYEPYPEVRESTLRVFLLGSCLGAILHQRGHLVLHANAIRVGDGVVLFSGDQGAGKSTTAAVFHQKGFQVIADDVVAIDQNELVIGGFPQIKLWEDALHHLDIEKSGLELIMIERQKYSYPIERYSEDHLPVKAVYFLDIQKEEEEVDFEFHSLEGISKFNYLKAHTYRPHFMEGLGLKPRHLDLCGRIADDVVAARILRPSGGFNAVQLVELVLDHLKKAGFSFNSLVHE